MLLIIRIINSTIHYFNSHATSVSIQTPSSSSAIITKKSKRIKIRQKHFITDTPHRNKWLTLQPATIPFNSSQKHRFYHQLAVLYHPLLLPLDPTLQKNCTFERSRSENLTDTYRFCLKFHLHLWLSVSPFSANIFTTYAK